MESDERLIDRCRHDDSSAFEELFERYSRRIYALTYRMTANRQEAEDILQDVFLRAYEYIMGYRRISNFYPWLCRVAINLAMDYHRSSHSRESLEFGEGGIGLSANIARSNPQSAVESKELVEQINAAVETLPLRQRQVFALKNVAGLSHKEIALVLGCSQDSVRANLYQAVRKLREKLRKYLVVKRAAHSLDV